MKIHPISDLHLEFGYQTLPGGDVLILAGDMAETRSITRAARSINAKKLSNRIPGAFPCWDFFEYECCKYEKVFYVLGNHEHYHGYLHKSFEELNAILPSNITLLEDQCEEYKGVLFVGSTLWTDCNKADPITLFDLKQGMNDFRIIQHYYANRGVYHKLTPEYTVSVHKTTLEYLKNTLENNKDKPVVVITHHAPSKLSTHLQYLNDYHMNGGYSSDLSNFILDHENIKLWIHGHTHDRFDYNIGNTRIVCNPRGYLGHEDNSQFDPNRTIEI
jgi:Icc-related predicted phosphoesterase